VFSQTYAGSCSKSFKNEIVRGHNPDPQNRYLTVTGENISPKSFRRIIERPSRTSKRDYLEYTLQINKDMNTSSRNFLNSYVRSEPNTISPFKYKRDLNGSPNYVKQI
jgi:hypothetical protein